MQDHFHVYSMPLIFSVGGWKILWLRAISAAGISLDVHGYRGDKLMNGGEDLQRRTSEQLLSKSIIAERQSIKPYRSMYKYCISIRQSY